jgi:hypothetical protein
MNPDRRRLAAVMPENRPPFREIPPRQKITPFPPCEEMSISWIHAARTKESTVVKGGIFSGFGLWRLTVPRRYLQFMVCRRINPLPGA